MLTSLPTLLPADPNSLWYTPLSNPSQPTSTTSSTSLTAVDALSRQQQAAQAHSNHPQGRRNPHAHPPPRTLLSDLRADERAILARKANIRRFGAGWLKPPGLAKTLQALDDEKAEREEQELNAQREAALAEQQMAMEEAEAEERARRGEVEGEDGMEGERDLDAEIPDMDADLDGSAGEEGEADEGDYEDDGWEDEVDEDEGGMMTVEGEGDYGVASHDGGANGRGGAMTARLRDAFMSTNQLPWGEDADLPDHGADEADMDGMDGPDLDDDVPEAGSYEHTDTEAEDEDDSDEDEEDDDDEDVATTGFTAAQRAAAVDQSQGISGSEMFGTAERSFSSARRSGGGAGGAPRQ